MLCCLLLFIIYYITLLLLYLLLLIIIILCTPPAWCVTNFDVHICTAMMYPGHLKTIDKTNSARVENTDGGIFKVVITVLLYYTCVRARVCIYIIGSGTVRKHTSGGNIESCNHCFTLLLVDV
jgi:hypothetical protein